MRVEISVLEFVDLFKEIQSWQGKVLEMIRVDIRESVGEYLSNLMDIELTHFSGKESYERG